MFPLFTACLTATALIGSQSPVSSPRPVSPRTVVQAPASSTIKTGRCDVVAPYNIPAQRFDETAQAIAHASGCFIKFDNPTIAATRVNGVHGRMSLHQALQTAIRGTKLRIVKQTPDLLQVEGPASK